MKKRTLGNTNIEISEIGFGCMGITHAYGLEQSEENAINIIKIAYNAGCNFFDTAPVYGENNEIYLGKAVKEIGRKNIVIATKFGIIEQSRNAGHPINELDSKPDSIRKQVEESLKRLDTDYIDLYYQHRVDLEVEPEDVAQVMKELINEGKIKAWGTSNAPIEYVKRAHKICPISAIENQYSFVYRKDEKELFELCEELGITFVAYSPLGNGFLTGKYNKDTKYEAGDFRNTMGRFKAEVFDHNKILLDLINDKAKEKGCTPAQITLAWELAQRPYIVPIPGSTKEKYIKENLGASNVKLTEKDMIAINEAVSKIDIDETHF